MLASPEALLCGRLEAFSPVAALLEACVLALGAVVCAPGVAVAGAAGFVVLAEGWDAVGVWLALCGLAVVCEAIALELVVEPVTDEAWLFGFVLVELVSPFVGFVAPGMDMLCVRGAETEPPVLTSCWLLFLLAEAPALGFTVSCSFTCFTPETDFATSFARFSSALEATVPVMSAVPFVTDACTFTNAGSWLNLL